MATRRRTKARTLTGALSDVQERLRYVEARPSYSRLAAQVVRRTNVQPRAIASDQLAIDGVTAVNIATDAVTNDQLAPDSVTNENISDNSVTTESVSNSSITNEKLADDSVSTAKIRNLAVTTEKINNSAVTTEKINSGAVTTDKINGSAVTTEKINDSAVTTSKLAFGAVITEKIGAGQVSTDNIGQGQVRTNNIDFASITRPKLAVSAVGVVELGVNAVATEKIQNDAVTRAKLNFTPVETVSAGGGLSGGGSARSLTLSVNFDSVARSNHGHSQYSATNHTHSGSTTSVSGTTVANHSHGISGLSTRKMKKDIEDYSIDPNKVLDLSLKRFRYLNHAKKFQQSTGNRDWNYGYIAEEVLESGLEELLVYDENGEPFGLNYGLVGVLSLELIKSMKNEIEDLKNKVYTLEEERKR